MVFGPKPRDFSKKVSKNTKQLALRKALSERLNAGDVLVVDDIKLASPRQGICGVLDALKVDGSTLFVAQGSDHNLMLASPQFAKSN